MALLSYVLNDPSLHRSLSGHDRWRLVGVEHHRLLACAYLGDEELTGLIVSLNWKTRVVDTGALLSPPNRCWLVFKPVKIADVVIIIVMSC